MGVLFLIILTNPLFAQEEVDHQRSLDEAIRYYHSGDRASAMQKLLSLSYNESAPAQLRLTANVYIGEIMYIQGDKESAQRLFEQVLKMDKNYRIDRFRHPPDVCSFFDFVKSYVNIPEPPKTVEPKESRIPISAYFPYGLYHLQHGSAWKGYGHLATQTITSTTSIGLLIYLSSNNTYIEGDEEKRSSLERLALVQRASTLLFYGLWATSVFDAQQHWNLQLQPSIDESTAFIPYMEWNTTF